MNTCVNQKMMLVGLLGDAGTDYPHITTMYEEMN
jgi:hypothetical protein